MKADLIDTISHYFLTDVRLLRKKLFTSFPTDKIPHHLTRSNLEVLFVLFELRRTSVTDLCNRLCISRPNMTPLINKLVQHDWVERQTSSEDRRVIQIAITTKGDQFCKEIHELLLSQIKLRLESLETEDLIELKRCMDSLKSIAKKISW
ncbi:MarR family transcriptional regulator [Cohnella abietis]|uniref:HTH marR-type domain-containing protein n=1 Tax=Cohnella abietis TaxID=2507935 RepID=A0A3T1DDZ2_9BACL|nr:MarR family transcriptional regulator [Cohnella abietis]BBI36312.1 hypothetical protein KCTCHS21_57110 [Cohnella abietis]